jgi:serine/threonine protein kinase
MATDLVGKTLGTYNVERILGKGSTGLLYQAFDASRQRNVAVRLLSDQFTRRQGVPEGLANKALSMMALEDPGLVRVLDFGAQQQQFYIVMEFLPGKNLHQQLEELIQARRWFPLDESIRLIEQLSSTLEYACRQPGFHTDLQPRNLMFRPSENGASHQVVLIDLGLTVLLNAEPASQNAHTITDSPAYMSPEQILGKEPDLRSHVYSLGILLYELAVGISPFPIHTKEEALHYHLQEVPPRPRSILPELPAALEQVIHKALEKDPARRYSRPAELQAALSAAWNSSTVLDEPQDMIAASVGGETQVEPSSATEEPETRIQIVSKSGSSEVFTLRSKVIAVGREKSNQITLDDPKASRRHTLITWDGSNYLITDLNSRNGTYLGSARLQPNTPERWQPHQELIIGDTSLRLLRSPLESKTVLEASSPSGTMVEENPAGSVNLSVMPEHVSVEPGDTASVNVSVINQSATKDRFVLSVLGIPETWVGSPPPYIDLKPGERKVIALRLHVPRTSQYRAGRYSLKLSISNQRDPHLDAELNLTLTLAAYSEFKAVLQPQSLKAGQSGQVIITNQGNLQELFTLNFKDAANELVFQPPYLQVQIPEGKYVIAEFYSQPRQQQWIGGTKVYSFQAEVSLPKEHLQELHGQLSSQALIPLWVFPILLLFCVFVSASSAAVWWYARSSGLPTPTLVALNPPGAEITSELLNGNSASFAFNAKDGGNITVTFECQLDNSGFSDCVSPKVYRNLVDGAHTFQVRAKGTTENIGSFNWTINTTALDTTITNTPATLTNQNLATFAFNGTNSGTAISTFECDLDGKGFQACISPQSYSNLMDGNHIFKVKAKDTAGNTDQFPASFSWTIDTSAPDTMIMTKPPDPSNNSSALFDFTRADSGTDIIQFECRLDEGNFTPCVRPTNYGGLSDGLHTFQVRAKDATGNVDPSPAIFRWTITVTTLTVQAQTQVSQAQQTQAASIQQTSTAQAQRTPTAQPTPSPVASPTVILTATNTATSTSTGTPTNTATSTPTQTPTLTFTPNSTGTVNANGSGTTNLGYSRIN